MTLYAAATRVIEATERHAEGQLFEKDRQLLLGAAETWRTWRDGLSVEAAQVEIGNPPWCYG